jgi:hypothetical protein
MTTATANDIIMTTATMSLAVAVVMFICH